MDQMNMAITSPFANAVNNIGAQLGNGVLTASGPFVKQETIYRLDRMDTVITRYEKAENGWIVYVAQHEGEHFKRYIAATLEEAHKQVSAYIAAERLDR